MWFIALVSGALAAEFTEMPAEMRADLDIGYAGDFGFMGLEEDGRLVAWGSRQRHDLAFGAEFAPVKWAAVGFSVPLTPAWSANWTEAYEMVYDPVTETGTYLGSDPLTDLPSMKGGGGQGVWLNAAVAPFSSSYGSGVLHQLVDWRLGVGVRMGGKDTQWTATDGQRGAATGGGAWRLSAAFSATRGASSPYLAVEGLLEGKSVAVDVVDDAGNPVATGLPVDAASSVQIRGGVELLDASNAATGYRFVWDLYLGFGYTTWQDVPSGFGLPDVLDVSQQIPVTEADYVSGRLGIATIIDFNKYAGMRLGVEGRYALPHRVEHVYPIYTSIDTFDVVANVALEGRIR